MNKIIKQIKLPFGTVVYVDNCRLVYHDEEGQNKMYCINHDENDDSTHVFLTKDNQLDCLVCEREYAIAKKKGLI